MKSVSQFPSVNQIVTASDSQTIYAIFSSFFFGSRIEKSVDGGETWTLPETAPKNPSTLALHPTIESTIYTGGVAGALWRSDNGGETWTELETVLSQDIMSLAVIDTKPLTLYVATKGGGLFKSDDEGKSWSLLRNEVENFVTIASVSNQPEVLYAVLGGSLHKSTDGGKRWVEIDVRVIVD